MSPTSKPITSILSLTLSLIFPILSTAAAIHRLSPKHTHSILRTRQNTSYTSLAEEIQCYSLPYGLFGTISHILSYYNMVCLIYRRKAYWPPSRLEHSTFNILIGIAELLGSVVIGIITILRCHERTSFVVLVLGRIVFSIAVAYQTISTSWHLKSKSADEGSGHAMLHFLLWLSALLLYTAVSSIIIKYGLKCSNSDNNSDPNCNTSDNWWWTKNHTIAIVDVALASLLFLSPAYMIWHMCGGRSNRLSAVVAGLGVFVVAIWTDWLVSFIANNWYGWPLERKVLFWVYFVFKRLPLFAS